jgi:hypothetical protein
LDLWNSWQGLPDDRAWHLEHVHHIFCQPEPLPYHVIDEAFIFRASGLYFLWWAEEDEHLQVFDSPEVSLAQVIGLLYEDDWHSIRDVTLVGAQEEVASEEMKQHYSRQLSWELDTVGRNRWIEQQERGGMPPSAYCKSVPRRAGHNEKVFLLVSCAPRLYLPEFGNVYTHTNKNFHWTTIPFQHA